MFILFWVLYMVCWSFSIWECYLVGCRCSLWRGNFISKYYSEVERVKKLVENNYEGGVYFNCNDLGFNFVLIVILIMEENVGFCFLLSNLGLSKDGFIMVNFKRMFLSIILLYFYEDW